MAYRAPNSNPQLTEYVDPYPNRDPWTLANGQPFNYGAPGSLTETINSQNPTAALDKPYVQAGDTGGFLMGTGITIGPGSSVTPAQQAEYNSQIDSAVASGLISQAEVDAWKKANPGDEHRWKAALLGGGEGSNDRGGSSVANAWNNQSGRADDFWNQLMARSKQSLLIDRNDPNIRAEADAYRANQDRSRREYLNDTAERQGPVANLLGEQRLTQQRVGQATGAFEAQLMNQEKAARRDEIAQALSLMAGRLTAEQSFALQRELAQLEADLRREGYGYQNDQFNRRLGFDVWDRQNYWNDPLRGL